MKLSGEALMGDREYGIDLHEVEPLLSRDRECLLRRHDPKLRPGVVDDADFADSNPFVYPGAVIPTRASVECDNYLLAGCFFHHARP